MKQQESLYFRDEHGSLTKQAKLYEDKALKEHYFGEEDKVWYYLLMKELHRFGRPHEPTKRQKEIQKLFIQRGTLERTRQNLYAVFKDPDHAIQFQEQVQLDWMFRRLQSFIETNKRRMATVKERIPHGTQD